MASVLKTDVPKGIASSNLALSAIYFLRIRNQKTSNSRLFRGTHSAKISSCTKCHRVWPTALPQDSGKIEVL